MTKCDEYLEDPDAHAAHLETCADCRAVFEELDGDVEVETRPLSLDALPLAPWEGASHRPWGLVFAAAVAALVLAATLFLVSGQSPVAGVWRAALSSVSPFEFAWNIASHLGGALRNAPLTFQIGIAVSFFAVNTVLFLLLRRAPKGIDA
ncbi:MAG TPA: hypothetical protein VGF69_09045 [Thermoanaerobaculia bacterium]|jgi:hypothetical protein